MLKGAMVAFGIMLGSIAIPLVHWVTFLPGPFIAGFFGGGVAEADEDRIIKFGLLVAGMMLLPVAGALGALFVFDVGGIFRLFLIVIAVVIVPYTWFGVTVGALLSYVTRKKAAEKAAADASGAPPS